MKQVQYLAACAGIRKMDEDAFRELACRHFGASDASRGVDGQIVITVAAGRRWISEDETLAFFKGIIAGEEIGLLRRIADYVRYDEKYQSIDWDGAADDAFETANWCIEESRAVLGLPEESADEEERRLLREDEEAAA